MLIGPDAPAVEASGPTEELDSYSNGRTEPVLRNSRKSTAGRARQSGRSSSCISAVVGRKQEAEVPYAGFGYKVIFLSTVHALQSQTRGSLKRAYKEAYEAGDTDAYVGSTTGVV